MRSNPSLCVFVVESLSRWDDDALRLFEGVAVDDDSREWEAQD